MICIVLRIQTKGGKALICLRQINENVDFHGWQSTEAECIQLLEEKKKVKVRDTAFLFV